jgi:hypothetical protein
MTTFNRYKFLGGAGDGYNGTIEGKPEKFYWRHRKTPASVDVPTTVDPNWPSKDDIQVYKYVGTENDVMVYLPEGAIPE